MHTSSAPVKKKDVFILTVVQNRPVARNIWQMRLSGELARLAIQPGQFVHLRCGNSLYPLLRRPISICDVDPAKEEVTLLYRVQGEGTRYFASLRSGDQVDVLGPLGSGFPVNNGQKGEEALLIGGGIGIPPLYYLSKCLREKGVKVTHLLGFNQAEDCFLLDEFQALGPTLITTLNGSLGQQGVVTDLIGGPQKHCSYVYACGPLPMLKAVANLYNETDTTVYISLEQRMGCGVGACLACVCSTPQSEYAYKKVCTDGPVFQLGEINL